MQGLDLRTLEMFRAVAREGSVSGAAKKLNRVQSNVSTRMKQLEEQLEKTLFQRRKRGIALTPEGELLLSYAQRLLDLSEEASDALSRDVPRGPFRIGTMESTAAARLPDLLSRFHAACPEVAANVVTGTAGEIVGKLLGREIDVGFVAEPVRHEDLVSEPVFEEALVLVAPESFGPLDDPGDLSGCTMIAFEQGCAYRRYLEDWLLESGIAPGTVLSVGSYLAMLACVSAGTGFCVVPQSVLEAINSSGRFSRKPLAGKFAAIRTLMVTRRGYRSAKLDALREQLPAV
ncbi:LysR family transcriptional regulator [Nisaea acidiphila]|uniref:LysR family transcriptional regulator n=1 Tax=Nisaea acidiphila TaxID=1862145 RepID=A0A9J7ASH1_9PROT|nr:LysR family transcriptional regulator [Nisaea acidiphila]UUX50603.1 LysR family transcriptional regulator [Nisaea acidiphila]